MLIQSLLPQIGRQFVRDKTIIDLFIFASSRDESGLSEDVVIDTTQNKKRLEVFAKMNDIMNEESSRVILYLCPCYVCLSSELSKVIVFTILPLNVTLFINSSYPM